mgnify:CR=1 FL=1
MTEHLREPSTCYNTVHGWKQYGDGIEHEWNLARCGVRLYVTGPDHKPGHTFVDYGADCPGCNAELQRDRLDRAVELLEEALPILRRLDAYLDRVERSR